MEDALTKRVVVQLPIKYHKMLTRLAEKPWREKSYILPMKAVAVELLIEALEREFVGNSHVTDSQKLTEDSVKPSGNLPSFGRQKIKSSGTQKKRNSEFVMV